MDSLDTWLQALGLERYASVFADNDVDLDAVRLLTETDFEKLGISLGHRRKLLKAIAELNGTQVAAPVPQTLKADPVPNASVGIEGERRQLTVLFCDMVGFTELASRVDPEVLQGIIRTYEDACAVCITRYEGYVFQRLGDGIVAFFGYPLAHEGEAERSIHAGLSIIEALSNLDVPDAGNLAVRIGIATGLVVVSSAEKGAVGETMNLASRLQGIAQPGSIVVSERVQRLAVGSFDYEDLGEQTIKGIGKPTHAYRIVGLSEAASRFEAAHDKANLTPLVGREQEIGLLLERWQLAQDGEGQVILVSGEPGIGKSRILSALRERLESEGARSLRFQCSPYYVNSAFWPSIDNFERALKFGRDEQPESKLDKLEALIVTHYGRPISDVRFIAAMLSIPLDSRYGELAMTLQKFKDETLRSLVDVTEAAARKQPSVLLFEDLHWADPTTLEMLNLLIDRARTIPLLILLTHRPEFESRWSEHGHVTALNLSKLTRAQSGAMVSRVAGGKTLPGNLLEQVIAKTDGVPLFVEELTKSILESGELKEGAERYDYVGTTHDITIPATLRDSLMARLDRYVPVKEIAQLGAAIGREFSYELIEAVAPKTKSELDRALTQLTESGLAYRKGTPPDAVYTFKHALVQDAAYDSLLKSKRQELHGKIARVIEERFPDTKDTEPEVLAHHYTGAGQIDRAIEYLERAGKYAVDRSANTEAVRVLQRAIDLVNTLPETTQRFERELELQTALASPLMAVRVYSAPEVGQLYERAYHLSRRLKNSARMYPALAGIASFHVTRAELARSLQLSEEMLDMAEAERNEEAAMEAHRLCGMTRQWMGDLTAARRDFARVLALYDPVQHQALATVYGQDHRMSALCWEAWSLLYLGYPEKAISTRQAALAAATAVRHMYSRLYASSVTMNVLQFVGDAGELKVRAAELTGQAEEHGFPVWAAWGYIYGGWARARLGDPNGGLKQIDAGLELLRSAQVGILMPLHLGAAADILLLLGRLNEACEQLRQIIDHDARTGERWFSAEAHRLMGEVMVKRGHVPEAEKCFYVALQTARSQDAKGWELRTAISLSRLWQTQGRHSEAHELLAPIYDWFTEGFNTKDLKEAKARLDELSQVR